MKMSWNTHPQFFYNSPIKKWLVSVNNAKSAILVYFIYIAFIWSVLILFLLSFCFTICKIQHTLTILVYNYWVLPWFLSAVSHFISFLLLSWEVFVLFSLKLIYYCLFILEHAPIFIDFKKRIGLEVTSKKKRTSEKFSQMEHSSITFIQLQLDNYLSSCPEPVWLHHFNWNPKRFLEGSPCNFSIVVLQSALDRILC